MTTVHHVVRFYPREEKYGHVAGGISAIWLQELCDWFVILFSYGEVVAVKQNVMVHSPSCSEATRRGPQLSGDERMDAPWRRLSHLRR